MMGDIDTHGSGGSARIAAHFVCGGSMPERKPEILAQPRRPTALRARARDEVMTPIFWLIVAVMFGLSGVAAYGLAPDTTLETVPTHTVLRPLQLPRAAELADTIDRYWREERIRRGDTVGSVLARMGVDDADALAFLRVDRAARAVYQLRPGRPLRVATDEEGRLLELRMVAPGGDMLTVARAGDRFDATMAAAPVETRWKIATGEIRSSLYAAGDVAGLPDAITTQLADVFAADIDFHHDLQAGDRFAVVYEMRYVDGELLGPGRIVAADFAHEGKMLRAFLFHDDSGRDSYYGEDGRALRKSFLRSPVEFSRITSGFSEARFHPILQYSRAHRGVDYAAPLGTPVRATSAGRVLFVGAQNGYGNVVQLEHQGTFSTLYAHLSRFGQGLRAGAKVAQGEVIGYVGQTGWATGPHLHYEFRVGDDQLDPLTLALPDGEPLAESQKPLFLSTIAPAQAQLAIAQSLPRAFAVAGD
jgi:murein DD-endopeptidase MepM/ murein hydrolase activator NlpD